MYFSWGMVGGTSFQRNRLVWVPFGCWRGKLHIKRIWLFSKASWFLLIIIFSPAQVYLLSFSEIPSPLPIYFNNSKGGNCSHKTQGPRGLHSAVCFVCWIFWQLYIKMKKGCCCYWNKFHNLICDLKILVLKGTLKIDLIFSLDWPRLCLLISNFFLIFPVTFISI